MKLFIGLSLTHSHSFTHITLTHYGDNLLDWWTMAVSMICWMWGNENDVRGAAVGSDWRGRSAEDCVPPHCHWRHCWAGWGAWSGCPHWLQQKQYGGVTTGALSTLIATETTDKGGEGMFTTGVLSQYPTQSWVNIMTWVNKTSIQIDSMYNFINSVCRYINICVCWWMFYQTFTSNNDIHVHIPYVSISHYLIHVTDISHVSF